MNPVVMTLSVLLLLVTGSQLGLGEDLQSKSGSGRETVNLAVQIVYDQEFKAISKFSDYYGRFLGYFTVFLNIVETWLSHIRNPQITLTLHAAIEGPERGIENEPDHNNEDDSRTREIEESSEEPHSSEDTTEASSLPCRNRSVTMKKLNSHVKGQENVYQGADAVIFVTGRCVVPKFGDDETFEGFPAKGLKCQGSGVATVHDDGSTFSGARSAALQLALMLGAQKEEVNTDCKVQDENLISDINPQEPSSQLLLCSLRSLSKFLEGKSVGRCTWETPIPAMHNRKMLAAEYYQSESKDLCQVSSLGSQESRNCTTTDPDDVRNKQSNKPDICQEWCCSGEGESIRNSTRAADGTPCMSGKICLSGDCMTDPRNVKTNKGVHKK